LIDFVENVVYLELRFKSNAVAALQAYESSFLFDCYLKPVMIGSDFDHLY
jgi:hypothetical protein